MERQEVISKLNGFAARREGLMIELVPAARAAANMLKDMKMDRTAEPLLELLFKPDALVQETGEFIRADPDGVIGAVLGIP